MNSNFPKILAFSIFLLSFPSFSFSSQWINPKDAIGNPMIARLQQGREELTPSEKEEVKRYGYTGLELMTYLFDNKHPGYQDNEEFHRCLNYTGGSIKDRLFFLRRKYYYKNMKDKITYKGLEPGKSVEYKILVFVIAPPVDRGFSVASNYYVESKKKFRDRDDFYWVPSLRRLRRSVPSGKQDEYMNMIVTWDDDEVREPWEEDHRVLGEDIIGGKECLVVESKHRIIPDYYLGKRVTWVEKENFLELHQEQFDRRGELYKIFDMDWYQLRPGNHWVPRQTNGVKLPGHERTVHLELDWIVDHGFTEEDMRPSLIERESPWRKANIQLKPVNSLSDFPPEPKIRWEFWNKIGVKVVVND